VSTYAIRQGFLDAGVTNGDGGLLGVRAVADGLRRLGALDGMGWRPACSITRPRIDYMACVADTPGCGLDHATMVKFIEDALGSAGLMVPVLAVFTLLPIGLCVLAYGLIEAKVVPAWVAVLVPLGVIGIAGTLQYTVLLILSALALIAGFGCVGVKLLKPPGEALAQAPAV
jgi:hypothetical protein